MYLSHRRKINPKPKPKSIHLFPRLLFCCSSAFFCIFCISALRAGEPAQRFLNELREKGYYDTALDYLAQMETSPLAPIDFKRQIQFERGMLYVDSAGEEFDLRAREQRFDQAEKAFNTFLQESSSHTLAQAARNQLSNLLRLRGIVRVELSKSKKDPALLNEARGFFDRSFEMFTKAEADLKGKLAPINNKQYDDSQAEEKEARDQMRKDYLQAQLLAAEVLEERASTVTPGSPEYADMIQKAAERYAQIEQLYRSRAAGLYAKLYHARCLKKLGKNQEALVFLNELFELPPGDLSLLSIKTDALQLAFEIWLDPSIKYYAEAVNRGAAWQQIAQPKDLHSEQGLAIQLELARAHKLYAEFLKEKDPKDRQIQVLLRTGRKLASDVSRFASPAQEEARKLLVEFRGGDPDDVPAEKPEPKSFAEARDAARDAMDAMENATFLIEALPERLEAETDPQIKADLEKQLEQARKDEFGKRKEAINYLRQCLDLIDKETPIEDTNLARVMLAQLLYMNEDFMEAAVLADFVAKRYPAHAAARDAAQVALVSYARLYVTAAENDRQFETKRMRDAAEYIIAQWPDQAVAADAWSALIPFIAESGELDRAREGIEKIPANSPQRGEVELKVGRAIWSAYRSGLSELRKWQREGAPSGIDLKAKQAQLDQWKTQSQQILAAGFDRVRGAEDDVDASLVLAALSLAQVYVETQQAAEAVKLLEDPQVGPLTLVRSQHVAASGEGMAEETFRTALRAYLGSLAAGANAEDSVTKAKGIMDELKSRVSDDAEGQQRLLSVYISLVRDLKGQMDLATPEERSSLSQGFEAFLSELAKETNDFQVLNWAGETFFNLAESLDDTKRPKANKAAERLYREALTIYQKILSEVAQKPEYLPAPQYGPLLRVRTAMINRRLGEYVAAMETLKEILTENNLMLSVQVEAARTYQMWAGFPDKHELYKRAMMGYYPDKTARPPKNIVWGWGQIGRVTTGRKEFAATFYEARYNLAYCRFHYAMKSTDAEVKAKNLDLAKQDIWFTYRLYPELGGADWQPKFDELLKEIQTARKQKAVGLAEFAEQLKKLQTSQAKKQ